MVKKREGKEQSKLEEVAARGLGNSTWEVFGECPLDTAGGQLELRGYDPRKPSRLGMECESFPQGVIQVPENDTEKTEEDLMLREATFWVVSVDSTQGEWGW